MVPYLYDEAGLAALGHDGGPRVVALAGHPRRRRTCRSNTNHKLLNVATHSNGQAAYVAF